MNSDSVLVPVVTPKNINDFYSLINHILAGGIKNLLLFGTTGEGNKFSLEEKKFMINQLVPFINTRANLFIALFGTSLQEIIELTNFCDQMGFKAALIPLTYANDERFFSQLLEKTQINYYLYNTPTASTTTIRNALFNMPRIKGIKDSSGNIEFLKDLIQKHQTDNFKIYYGRETQIDKALQLGIDGIVIAAANIDPALIVRLWEKQDEASFSSLQELKQHVNATSAGIYSQGIKNILIQKGIISTT